MTNGAERAEQNIRPISRMRKQNAHMLGGTGRHNIHMYNDMYNIYPYGEAAISWSAPSSSSPSLSAPRGATATLLSWRTKLNHVASVMPGKTADNQLAV